MKLQDLKEMSFEREELSKLPDTFEGIYSDEEFRKDAREKDCLYVTIDIKDGGQIVQKYSAMHLTEFVKALEALKVKDSGDLLGKMIEWKRVSFRIGNARWIPSRIVR